MIDTMTYHQRRVNACRAEIPGADSAMLTRIHNHLLQLAPMIRVRTRWGDRTAYAIKIRQSHAVELTRGTNRQIAGNSVGDRYRIEFGATLDGGASVNLLRWEPDPFLQWEEWDADGLPERLWEWLRKYQPAAEVLLEIDMILLQMGWGSNG